MCCIVPYNTRQLKYINEYKHIYDGMCVLSFAHSNCQIVHIEWTHVKNNCYFLYYALKKMINFWYVQMKNTFQCFFFSCHENCLKVYVSHFRFYWEGSTAMSEYFFLPFLPFKASLFLYNRIFEKLSFKTGAKWWCQQYIDFWLLYVISSERMSKILL